jgi:hypothetical protein
MGSLRSGRYLFSFQDVNDKTCIFQTIYQSFFREKPQVPDAKKPKRDIIKMPLEKVSHYRPMANIGHTPHQIAIWNQKGINLFQIIPGILEMLENITHVDNIKIFRELNLSKIPC